MEILKINNFSYEIGRKKILKNISLNVMEGEFVFIIGPNGSGKSTLLKSICRINQGGRGDILIKGIPREQYTFTNLARLLGYVSQGFRAVPYTVYEYLCMARYPYSKLFAPLTKREKDLIEQIVCKMELQDFLTQTLNTLSGGELQKVSMAAALVQEPKILLLDEPLTFLDPKHQEDIKTLLKKINEELKITIIAVTHQINFAALFGCKIIGLKAGKIVFMGQGDKLMQGKQLRDIYSTDFFLEKHPCSDINIILERSVLL